MDFSKFSRYGKINRLVSQGQYYEALQHILSAVTRNLTCRRYNESLDALYYYSKIFAAAGEITLIPHLLGHYMKIAQTAKIACNNIHIERLASIFDAAIRWYNPGVTSTKEEKSENLNTLTQLARIAHCALHWSKCPEMPTGSPLLHSKLGDYYAAHEQYARGHDHLIHAQDIEKLFALVTKWKDQGEKDEHDFFYLRTVLILLSLGDCSGAKCFLLLMDVDFENPDIPIPLQIAHLMAEACEASNGKLFERICEVYKRVLELDAEYPTLVEVINNRFFLTPNHPCPNTTA